MRTRESTIWCLLFCLTCAAYHVDSKQQQHSVLRKTIAKFDENNEIIENLDDGTPQFYKTTAIDTTSVEQGSDMQTTKGETKIESDKEAKGETKSATMCGKNSELNTETGECKCLPGFDGKDPNVKCVDINECSILNPCLIHENSHCLNNRGSFKCQCDEGYLGHPMEGQVCKKRKSNLTELILIGHSNKTSNNDTKGQPEERMESVDRPKIVDTCTSSELNICGDYINSFCAELPDGGGYTCECDEGFVGNPLKGQECTITCDNPYGNPCGPDNICKTTKTGHTCEILDNIDHCPGTCSPTMHCEKLKSGYECVCNPGHYQPNEFFPCRPIGT